MRFSAQDCARIQADGYVIEANPRGGMDDLLITSHVLRCRHRTEPPTVFAQGPGDEALNAVVDAVHWLQNDPTMPKDTQVRVAVRRSLSVPNHADHVPDETVAALQRLAYMGLADLTGFDLYTGRVQFQPIPPQPDPVGDLRLATWHAQVQQRSAWPLPVLAQAALGALAGRVPSFRWYRSVTGRAWSGRVAGWQVCTVADGAQAFRWHTGGQGPKSTIANASTLSNQIIAFAKQRADPTTNPGKYKQEHLLESAVLRGAVPVHLAPGRPALTPLVAMNQPPFQFPALFAAGGPARFVDALVREDGYVAVAELKVATSGEGQGYRHAITQAALYRDFVRRAVVFHPWFASHGIDAQWCQGLVVFPRLRSPRAESIRASLKRTATFFDVRIIELDQGIDAIRHLAMA